MTYRNKTRENTLSDDGDFHSQQAVDAVAAEIFETLTRLFPVCTASDEFYYFPQVPIPSLHWWEWDDFSTGSIQSLARRISHWEDELTRLAKDTDSLDLSIDISILRRSISTLREELTQVRFHETQPTHYLTIASIGLAQALDQDTDVWHEKVKNLPAFLDQARTNFKQIPVLFRDLGFEMLEETKGWVNSLQPMKAGLAPVLEALDRFGEHLRRVPTTGNFLLGRELLERIVHHHMGCGMDIEEAYQELEMEILEAEAIMDREAWNIHPGRSWPEVLDSMSPPSLPEGGLVGLYRETVLKLGQHCVEQGLVTERLFAACPVQVEPMPSYLSAVRSASSYSMPPGHPPKGGTFFVIDTLAPKDRGKPLPLDYQMLTAHETYPGHHLLDTHRWSLDRALRRHLEFPLFYEGWACFAEELMAYTGYFQGAADRLLLAKRRLWRAVRGKVDLEIQTGKKDLSSAVCLLIPLGMSKKRALSTVRKYALNPGYQLCYTIGLRRLRDLYRRFGKDDSIEFALKVLNQGEIGFDNLERILFQ